MAIDLGSSSVRCAVFDLAGGLKALAKAEPLAFAPEGLSPLAREYDPRQLWKAVCRLVQEALTKGRLTPSDIVAVSSTSQREAVVFLDKDGHELYVGPNLDLRAFFEGAAIDESIGPLVYRTTGHTPSFMFAPAKAAWFKHHNPGLFDRIASVLPLDSWINFRLTGVTALEKAAAGEVGLLDVTKGCLASDMLSRMEFPPCLCGGLMQSGAVVGALTRVAADETGLAPGTPIVLGGPDTQCGLLGLGVTGVGDAGLLVGWSATVQAVTGSPLIDPKGRLWTGLHVLLGRWVLESNASEGGKAHRWLAQTVLGSESDYAYAQIERMVAEVAVGSDGVVAFLGPRKGDMGNLGLRWGGFLFPVPMSYGNVGRGQLFRAALENLAYAIKSNVAQVEEVMGKRLGKLYLGGGLSRSRSFVQILADVLGTEALVSAHPEVSALGAAMCAATGVGNHSTLEESSKAMSDHITVVPEAVRSAEYQGYYQRWRDTLSGLEQMDKTL